MVLDDLGLTASLKRLPLADRANGVDQAGFGRVTAIAGSGHSEVQRCGQSSGLAAVTGLADHPEVRRPLK